NTAMPARGGRHDSYDSACSNHDLRIFRTPSRHGVIDVASPTVSARTARVVEVDSRP
ncbi:hypothetical protein THAOC_10536, partial [Thalassiosira oceanica]